jgi:hypothetical protein
VPAQHHLGRRLGRPAGDRADRRIVQYLAAAQRRPGFDRDLVLGAEAVQLFLGQIRIDLDLIDRRDDLAFAVQPPQDLSSRMVASRGR